MQARSLLIISVLLTLCFAVPALAEIKVITKTIKQPFGGVQSPEDARITAIHRVKRRALEEAGTYIESLTVVRKGKLQEDDILAIAAGVLKTEVLNEKKYISGDAFGIEVTARIRVDTAILEQRVRDFLNDHGLLKKYKDGEKKQSELLARIKELEAENNRLQKLSTRQKQELKEEFKEASKGLTATEWYEKANGLWKDGRFTDPRKAIEYYTKAVEINPEYAGAYGNRGLAYRELGLHSNAIRDYTKAIEIDPKDVEYWNNKGVAYNALGQYQNAMIEFSKALELNPNDKISLTNRGATYFSLEQYDSAIRDLDRAIASDPLYAQAYFNRGSVYHSLKKRRQAIDDYSKAIALRSDYADYYYNRANAYRELKEYNKAIQDYDKTITLNQNYATAWNNRAIAYICIGRKDLGCRDARKASSLGVNNSLQWFKLEGYCD